MDRASGAVESVSDASDGGDCVKGGYGRVIGADPADDSSQNEKKSSQKQNEHRFKNSACESRSWERDLTTEASSIRNSNACVENICTDRQFFQTAWKDWRPVYENISDPDSDPDTIIKGTKPSEEPNGELVSTKHVILNCDRPKNSECRRRHSGVRKHKAVSVNKRRHSAPETFERKRKKREKQETTPRRWSFNTESDIPQPDHTKTVKKPYLNRLVLWKDAKIKSWSVVIDLASDEQTTEESEVSVFPSLKNGTSKEGNTESKEAATAVIRAASSGADYAQESRPSNEEAKTGNYSSSGLNQEMNLEDEDTIEAPRGFFSVPQGDMNNTCSSRSVKEECSLSDETFCGVGDRRPLPRSACSNSVIASASDFCNETGRSYELPLETPESQTNEAGVVAKSLITELKADNTLSTKVILSADKSNLQAVKVRDSLENSSVETSVVAGTARDKRVKGAPFSSANSVQTAEYSSPEPHNQNTDVDRKKSRETRELKENLGSDACGYKVSGMGRRGSSQEGSSGTASDDTARKVYFSHHTADTLLANSEKVSGVGTNCATTENCLPSNSVGCCHDLEGRDFPGRKICGKMLETGKDKISKNVGTDLSMMSMEMSSQQDVAGEENIFKRSFENNIASYSSRTHNPVNCGQVNENDKYGVDTIKQLAIGENSVDRIRDQAHVKHNAGAQVCNENTAEDLKITRESHGLQNGGRGFCSSNMAKKRRRKVRIIRLDRQQHEASKETSGRNYRTRRKQHELRKLRYSRRRFRHDSIQMFKVSTTFPPHTIPVPWRYTCKKPEFPDPVGTQDANLPSPVLNPSSTQSRFDGNVTNIEIEDDIPSPGSLTIDLGDQNISTPETSNVEEDETSGKKCNSDANGGEEVSLAGRRKSSEVDSVRTKKKVPLDSSTENIQEQLQSCDLDSESSDEGQSRTKRKRAKKRKSGTIFSF
jgi:hypothetical protein